jgi:hypothetical protein
MAAVAGLTIVKKFTYRGDANEEYSNSYHLDGSVPANSTDWKALADAMIASEKTCYPAAVSVVRAYGYDSDDPTAHSVWSYDYALGTGAVAGTYGGAFVEVPGDVAYFAKWKTSRNNTKGKPIYLRKYFHGGGASSGNHDQVATTLVTAVAAHATKLWNGTFIDGRKIRSQSHAETITASGCGPYLTTRTLKRRGKRPGS